MLDVRTAREKLEIIHFIYVIITKMQIDRTITRLQVKY